MLYTQFLGHCKNQVATHLIHPCIHIDGLKKRDLIALLKQSFQDDEDNVISDDESKASFEVSIDKDDNPYDPYDQTLFGHDSVTTPNLVGDDIVGTNRRNS